MNKPAYFAPEHPILTVYGRKPVMEVLENNQLTIYRLHLAESNKPCSTIERMQRIAESRQIDIRWHERKALSRISKNGKQDQGVAVDVICPQLQTSAQFLARPTQGNNGDLIAIDAVTNPQNLGMIIRSVAAAGCAGVIIPERGCARLDALVIKASAGTLFKAPIIRCEQLPACLTEFARNGYQINALDVNAKHTLASVSATEPQVFVLGNETHGISKEVLNTCTQRLKIPMSNGVESLNVAMTATLLAYRHHFTR